MNAQKLLKQVLVVGAVVFILIQLIPVDHINSSVVQEPPWDSPQTRAFAVRACFDCHSNQTTWPWYSYVAPVSWFVTHHVDEGREHLNMSDWSPQQHGDEAAREVRKGKMPIDNYLWLHPEARLTENEKQEFIKGLIATFGEKKSQKKKNKNHQE